MNNLVFTIAQYTSPWYYSRCPYRAKEKVEKIIKIITSLAMLKAAAMQ